MKKVLSIALVLVMVLAIFAGCGSSAPAAAAKKTVKKEESAPSIENKAAATTLGDIDALAALKEQLEGKK